MKAPAGVPGVPRIGVTANRLDRMASKCERFEMQSFMAAISGYIPKRPKKNPMLALSAFQALNLRLG